jgi:hypothetical protein
MRGALVLGLLTALAHADEITGVVLDAEGKPAPGVKVQLEVGRARYALTPDFDRWYSVDGKTATTGADGRFAFADLPAGAVGTAWVNTGTAIGVAQGNGELTVKLAAPGGIQGKVTGKRNDLKSLRIFVQGGHGIGTGEGTVDKKSGKYEVGGLTPGPGLVWVMQNNWVVARRAVDVAAGKSVKLKTTKFRGKFLPSPDPQVDVYKAKLVDQQGNAVPSVQLIWSSRWMDGGMNSDAEGLVKLAGGGVAIGDKPYYLRLKSLKGERAMYGGVLKAVKRGVAVVEVHPLKKVTGSVTRNNAALDKYRLLVVGPGQPARVYEAFVENGTFTVHVPEGKCRFVAGTADGTLHPQEVEVKADGPETLDLQLK